MHTDDWDARSQELVWDDHTANVCLRNLFASTNQAIYFKDLNSRFMFVSRGVVQHTIDRQRRKGSTEDLDLGPEDFVGKTDMDLFEPELGLEWIAEEQRIMETGEAMVDVLERDTTFDGPGVGTGPAKLPCATTTVTSSGPSAYPGT